MRLQQGLTLQSREELQQTIGDDRQATAIVRHVIAAMAPSLARSAEDPRELTVLAAQVPAEWLPTVDGATFTRLEWDAAKHEWENECLRLVWVAAKVEGSALTMTIAEGNRCGGRGSHYVFLRTAAGWRAATEGSGSGFSSVCHPCARRYQELLAAAHHKSKREVELLIATRRPRPPLPTVIRRLPDRPASTPGREALGGQPTPAPGCTSRGLVPERAAPAPCGRSTADKADGRAIVVGQPHPTSIGPLSADRYKLQVTISQETHGKLRRAQDLLRHTYPNGDVAALLDRALTLLLADLERRRCAVTPAPRQTAATIGYTRHIPAAVRRAVWQRDRGRCAFVGAAGRCRETGLLEFHHVQPFAEGGVATDANIQLRCKAHNLYEASLFFASADNFVREAAGPGWEDVT